MEKSSEKLQNTEVLVRVYDLFDGIDALWVSGFQIERTKHGDFGCYEFRADTLLPLAICVANSCDNPSVMAMMESPDKGQVCTRGTKWRTHTARVPFNLAEFLFRALDGASGVVEVAVAVNEDMSKTRFYC